MVCCVDEYCPPDLRWSDFPRPKLETIVRDRRSLTGNSINSEMGRVSI
jgi:hypothetical protein